MTRDELYKLHELWYEGHRLTDEQISAVLILALDAFAPEEETLKAFEEGMRIGLLGYRTIEDVIAGEEMTSTKRKVALDRAREWVKRQLPQRETGK